jgi:hypothetical protein
MPIIIPPNAAQANPAWVAARNEVQRKLRLTPRWTVLKEHPMQALYFWHPARFKVNPSGRRSGKTELAKRKGVLRLVTPNRSGGPRAILFGGPTRDQAKIIFWEDLKALVPAHWVKKIDETLMYIITHWGARIRVMGMDRPQRMEGTPWDDVFLDEIADYKKKGCIELNVLPALSTLGREGGAEFLGVPDEVGPNQAEYEKYFEMGLTWPNNGMDICAFHWPSSDILDPKEMAFRKATMDEFAFRQEYGGAFIRSGGKAVPKFDYALHTQEEYTQYSSQLPVDWTLDFGTNVAASLIGQTYRGQVWIMDEIYIKDSSTETATHEFIRRMGENGYSWRHVRVFGDAAGRSPQSNIGASDYDIVGELLRPVNVEWFNLTHNPLVKDTLNAVRSRMVNSQNEINLWINKRCVKLIEDIKTAPWPDDLRQYHALAALRYYLWRLFGEPGARYETSQLSLPVFGGPRRPGVTYGESNLGPFAGR